jgi:mRNA interferase RelE/StbE
VYEVAITASAQAQYLVPPRAIQPRVTAIFQGLRDWPDASGARRLRGALQGAHRLRTGDYRVLFRVDPGAERITVFQIAHRRDVYEQ